MADAMEIIISAVDQASEVFESIINTAQSMADGIGNAIGDVSGDFDTISDNVSGFQDVVANVDTSTLEELADQLGMDTDRVQELISAGADLGTLSAGFNEAASAADELEKETGEAADEVERLGSAGDVMAAQTLMEASEGMASTMMDAADKAGTFNDSMMRASLEAQGAGISVDEMKNIVSDLSDTTGRAGGQIRESFIKATARGVTDMDAFKTMMEGAGAQATLFGVDIQTMGDKFSGMAMKSTLMDRTLAETGITYEELAAAMGMTGATADEVKAKWQELDVNQRANILGMAATMNEGQGANDAYKNSWAGLKEQVDIAKGKLERVAGEVLLPVLIPAMQTAGDIFSGVADAISAAMKGPFGMLISILGSAAGVFVIVTTGLLAMKNIIAFLGVESLITSGYQALLTLQNVLMGETSLAAALGLAAEGEAASLTSIEFMGLSLAELAALWPLALIVAAIAAVIAIAYEVGKAFGWWTDVGSMMDAIRTNVVRLWNAFINHPDVQAAISTISSALSTLWSWIQQAGQAVMDFFGINSEGNFDIVRALIDGIGTAWEIMTVPIRTAIDIITWLIDTFTWLYNTVSEVWTGIWNVIGPYVSLIVSYFGGLIDTINNFRTGQIDLYTFIVTILGQIWSGFVNFTTIVSNLLLQFAGWLLQRGIQAGRNLLNGVISWLRQLPGRAYNELLKVVGRIIQAGAQWVSSVKAEAKKVIDGATNTLGGIASAISSALSGVVDAFTKPFKDAWNIIKPYYDKIKGAIDTIGNAIPSFGGEAAYGGEIAPVSSNIVSTGNQTIDINHNVTLDLINVPAHIDTPTLVKAIQDREVLKALTSNSDFQSFDANVKERISLKNGRARGV